MEAIAHNPSFAQKVGVKQSVGKDFAAADVGKKFADGGLAQAADQFKMTKQNAEKLMALLEEMKKIFHLEGAKNLRLELIADKPKPRKKQGGEVSSFRWLI